MEVKRGLGFFERCLTLWVLLCIAFGIALGKIAPGIAKYLDSLAITVKDATVVGVLIEVLAMLMLVRICLRTQGWFKKE
jgi:ACR3 family arsenite transporter